MALMNRTPTAVALAREWLEEYRRERAESGERAAALVAGLREVADAAYPETPSHEAFALLLELLRLEDEDLEFDDVGEEG